MSEMRDVVTSIENRESYESSGLWTTDTVTAMVRQHAKRAPHSIAVVDGVDERQISYWQLWRDIEKLSSYFIANGIRHGDVVSVQLPNRYEAVVADLAALAAGAVLNPLLPNYRAHELRHILLLTGSKAIVTTDVYRKFNFVEMVDDLREDLPALQLHVVLNESCEIPSGTNGQSGAGDEILPLLNAADVSEIIFTSGTESIPKAVMHTEQTTNCAVRETVKFLGMSHSDVVWMPSPVGHSTGLNFGIRFAAYLGLPLVLQDTWNATRALELIAKYKCSYTLAATTFLSDLLAAASLEPSLDLSSMRNFSCGGAPVTAEMVQAARERGIGVLRLYGATETLSTTWMPHSALHEKVATTDGSVMPHVRLEIRDETGTAVQTGVAGEIVVRSANTAVGFFGDSERTERTFLTGGWVQTGDLGTLDEDGYITIVGRKKEIIIRGGINIAPREIEDVLYLMPGVQSVAVVGLPDERLGESACACIVRDANCEPFTVREVAGFLESHGIAKYKFPERVEFIDELPMTLSGKVQKHLLRAAILGDQVPLTNS